MPAAPARSVSVTPGQPLQAGVEQNDWLGNIPIVKDFRQAVTNNDWGNFWGSAIQGVPAGPLELGDMFGNIAKYSQDLGMQAGKAMFAPREVQNLPPFLQDMIDQGLEQSISPLRIPKFDMAGAYKNLMQPKMPGAFGGGAFVGQALIPVGGVKAGATIGQKLAQAALGGAAMSVSMMPGSSIKRPDKSIHYRPLAATYVETDPITKQPDFKKTMTIPFSKLGRHPLIHFANQYIPGKEPSDYLHKMQAQEQMLRQSRGQRMTPNSQFYPLQDIYNQPSPLDSFFGVPR